MEINYNNHDQTELGESSSKTSLIQVRAVISCPNCDYNKAFRNQFKRDNIELLVVALKCFDWMVCNNCGELLNLELEFDI